MNLDAASLDGGFAVVFGFSFLVALTGAMAPGPLLTYTIIKSAKTRRRGYLMGVWIIAGHAILEMAVIIALLLGFSFVLQNITVVRGIGVVGGVILVAFGGAIIRDIFRGRVPVNLMAPDAPDAAPAGNEKHVIDNPVLGGVLISMANPYWWVWWATIGFAFMVQFGISFSTWPALLAFFLGHEAGDLLWYVIVSTLAYFGLRRLNRQVYYGILSLCGLFMIGFGVYLGISPFLKGTV
ncbi:MAG: LysE family transporter [Pseudomonadota bacterium]